MIAKQITSEIISKTDSGNMSGIISNFPNQVRQACKIGDSGPCFISGSIPKNIIILGMGGSAIGGDILRSYSSGIDGASHLNIIVNRN